MKARIFTPTWDTQKGAEFNSSKRTQGKSKDLSCFFFIHFLAVFVPQFRVDTYSLLTADVWMMASAHRKTECHHLVLFFTRPGLV